MDSVFQFPVFPVFQFPVFFLFLRKFLREFETKGNQISTFYLVSFSFKRRRFYDICVDMRWQWSLVKSDRGGVRNILARLKLLRGYFFFCSRSLSFFIFLPDIQQKKYSTSRELSKSGVNFNFWVILRPVWMKIRKKWLRIFRIFRNICKKSTNKLYLIFQPINLYV